MHKPFDPASELAEFAYIVGRVGILATGVGLLCAGFWTMNVPMRRAVNAISWGIAIGAKNYERNANKNIVVQVAVPCVILSSAWLVLIYGLTTM